MFIVFVMLGIIFQNAPVFAENGNSFGLGKTGFFDEEQKQEQKTVPASNANQVTLDPNQKEFWALDSVGPDGRKYPPQEVLNLVTNPSPENVKILREKTELAQQRLGQVMPLVENKGQNATDANVGFINEAEKQVISNISPSMSTKPQLLYFFGEHCGPCQKEEGVLEEFAKQNAIDVIAIPMDDKMPARSPFNVEIDPKLKEYYGITETPTLVVVTPRGAVKNAGFIDSNGIETLWQTAQKQNNQG